MHNLGQTRSALHRDHFLQTPDTFVRIPLPGLTNAAAVVHTGPAASAAFTEYTVEFGHGGVLSSTAHQRFLYVLEGELTLHLQGRTETLRPRGYAYVPPSLEHRFSTALPAQALVIERQAQNAAHDNQPVLLISQEDRVSSSALNGDSDLQVRSLLAENPALNFAVNTMTYQPGAALSQVEVHIMEHGLLMLEGGGIYRLGEQWYPVTAGDFIWMAPFCPQWFAAIGKQPAKYLIYKDWNQHPLAGD